MQSKKLIPGICLLLSLWLLAVPYFFPPCVSQVHGMGHMACWYTWRAEPFNAIMAVIVSSYLLLTANSQVKKALGLILCLCGLIAAALPQSWALGMCVKETMACHKTYLYTMVGAIPLFVLGISIFYTNFRIHKVTDEDGVE
ncbi:DUF4418 family protein [Sporomusa acidovorans]|uniref:DUF4418 domain-containing protein n=1 Tax=Sporomusa acidovorans (strain ATCC 49682 / DSM 3132 / Mol) TaxID=1123286 RepID=A0ABZ3IXB6_SPOA4|nr:DUF4418 family protein [Sporomusa acidovorans]OZC23378.1 hypothetical protein SPACI_07900 [Sporomusa acidovorans DSM 3132]SDE43532.1 protein of unknown function [Sporomusa acidovorans]